MNSLFHSAAVRLTLMYLTIIMGLSIGFSLVVYQLSLNELNAGLRRPEIMDVMRFGSFDFDAYREEQLDISHSRLKTRLVLFNVFTLVAGGLASYYFARRSLEPIEEAMERQKRFSSDASHELRTPLTVMQTELEVALRGKSLTLADARNLLESNLTEVKNLHGLAENLLRLARHDDNSLQISRVSATDTIQKAWQAVATKAAEQDIVLNFTPSKKKLNANASALTEVLTILFDNAIKYSEEHTKVTVTTEETDASSLIRVTDEGQGIPATELSRIFERFYRGDASRTKAQAGSPSYGLGLSIAKRLIEKQNGTITATSTVGRGSSFLISLPK